MQGLEYLEMTDEQIHEKRLIELQQDLIEAQRFALEAAADRDLLRKRVESLKEEIRKKSGEHKVLKDRLERALAERNDYLKTLWQAGLCSMRNINQ